MTFRNSSLLTFVNKVLFNLNILGMFVDFGKIGHPDWIVIMKIYIYILKYAEGFQYNSSLYKDK